MSYATHALAVLKERGYRITLPRRHVVDLLEQTPVALSAYEIRDRLEAAGIHVDTVSVYRILDCLEQNSLIHRVVGTGKVRRCQLEEESRCGLSQRDHCHHFLICRNCQDMAEIHCPGLDDLVREVQERSGFNVEAHHLEFTGLCRRCQG